MSQLFKKTQRNVDVHKEVYQKVGKLFVQVLRDYESDQHGGHRKLAISIEDVVLGHLRLQMLGEKERPRSSSCSPPSTYRASTPASSGANAPAEAPKTHTMQTPTPRGRSPW